MIFFAIPNHALQQFIQRAIRPQSKIGFIKANHDDRGYYNAASPEKSKGSGRVKLSLPSENCAAAESSWP